MDNVYFTFVCILSVIYVIVSIVFDNRDYDGKTDPGWWIIGLGISQCMIFSAISVWWREWWTANEWAMILSVIVAVLCTAAWIIVKIYQHRW